MGITIAASGRFPCWTGWVHAITTFGFVVSNFTIAEGQTPMSVLLFLAAVVVAWSAARKTGMKDQNVEAPSAA